ncbi:hypothetical protein Hanom_Chr12g01177391 [Helianthus anomalus]
MEPRAFNSARSRITFTISTHTITLAKADEIAKLMQENEQLKSIVEDQSQR